VATGCWARGAAALAIALAACSDVVTLRDDAAAPIDVAGVDATADDGAIEATDTMADPADDIQLDIATDPVVDPVAETGDGTAADEDGGDSSVEDFGHDAVWPAGCPASAALPAWVAADGDGAWVATCPGHSLHAAFRAADTVRLRYVGSAADPALPYAVLPPETDLPAATAGTIGGDLVACTSRLVVRLTQKCRVLVTRDDGSLIVEDGDAGGYAEKVDTFAGKAVLARTVARVAHAGERYYGFGEKTGALDKRGRVLWFWNTDHPAYASDWDPLYQSIPFYVGLLDGRAYGVFTDNSYRMRADVASTDPDAISMAAAGGEIDQWIFAGPSMAQVLDAYTRLTGRPPLPPRWTLGYHQCRWSYTPAQKVIDICKGFRARDIPADGIWLDIDYMDGFRSWTWDPVGFPDPDGLVEAVGDMGFKVTAIIDPGLKQDPAWDVYQQGLQGDHFLKGADGQPFVGEVWPGPAVFPDFTRPETRTWWASLVTRLTDRGVRGVWLDMNEPASFQQATGWTVPDDVAAYGEGQATTMAKVHNVYALAQNQATREGLLAAAPSRRPFLLTRAGYAGIQRHSAVWTGDAGSNFDALRDSLRILMGLGLSGVSFVGSDVGGWSGGGGAELFARWIALGSISPFFRAHVQTGAPDQEPWSFGAEVEDISRLHIRERYRLLPYLYSLTWEAFRSGTPALRPLVWEFQGDPSIETVDDQALLGPWVMAAPVLDMGASSRVVRFPAGRWLEYHSGALIQGPVDVTVPVTLQALPLYLREGAILPRGPVMSYSDQAPVDPLTLDVFPGAGITTFMLYEDAGDGQQYYWEFHATDFTLVPTSSGVRLQMEAKCGIGWTCGPQAPRRLVVLVRRADMPPAAVTVDGQPLAPLPSYDSVWGADPGWFHDSNDLTLLVAFTVPAATSPAKGQHVVDVAYDKTIADPAPPVKVPLKVTLPAGTPKTTPIHVATSAGGWVQQPLQWGGETDTAVGEVTVPRGQWFDYKYTRGSWESVEKWAGCLEATNRYAFGAAHPVKEDRVEAWADLCPL
jgi:alpha-glucosidase